ncbi:MAG TPA: hypothetical protein VMU52_05320 [Steroidobacteraceae bacterium]|nr:hypothetical protein [Steroidobacteraceae bacterium]
MNTFADSLPNTEQDQNETVRQEPKAVSDTALVELAKVSDTRGGWVGTKPDTGLGIIPY